MELLLLCWKKVGLERAKMYELVSPVRHQRLGRLSNLNFVRGVLSKVDYTDVEDQILSFDPYQLASDLWCLLKVN